MKRRIWEFFYFFSLCGLCFLLNGCIATSNEIVELREDIAALKSEITTLKRNQAEINSKMDVLNNNLGAYIEKLEENKYKMSVLAQRMDDVHSSLTQRMDILSKQLPKVDISVLPLPTELFQIAYSDYNRGMYDLAIRGFKSYLEKYPDSELAPKVYYYLADSYIAKKQYEDALRTVDSYLEKYTKDELVPSILYKKSQCLKMLSLPKQAKEIEDYIIKKYPNSKEAQTLKNDN